MVKTNSIRFSERAGESVLSPLECDALEFLWTNKKARVREIHGALKPKRKVALTSVAVILDRLHKRDLVGREIGSGRGGSHYIYFVKTSKGDFERSVLEDTVDKLLKCFGPSAVSYFNERFSKKRGGRK